MNPGLANTPLVRSRPEARGGFDFAERAASSVIGHTFRARRVTNRAAKETDEAGRLRDFQISRFQIRKAEWLEHFQDGDHLVETLGSNDVITWQVRTWHEIPGTRGLWVEVQAEELREGGEQ